MSKEKEGNVVMVEVDEVVYNKMLEDLAKMKKAEDKRKQYRKDRYNRIKSILKKAKAQGITS